MNPMLPTNGETSPTNLTATNPTTPTPREHTLSRECVGDLGLLRAAAHEMERNDSAGEFRLYLLPDEWRFFAARGWIKRIPDGRTLVTADCPACPAGVQVLPRKFGFAVPGVHY
jgi:hypothetical protein